MLLTWEPSHYFSTGLQYKQLPLFSELLSKYLLMALLVKTASCQVEKVSVSKINDLCIFFFKSSFPPPSNDDVSDGSSTYIIHTFPPKAISNWIKCLPSTLKYLIYIILLGEKGSAGNKVFNFLIPVRVSIWIWASFYWFDARSTFIPCFGIPVGTEEKNGAKARQLCEYLPNFCWWQVVVCRTVNEWMPGGH